MNPSVHIIIFFSMLALGCSKKSTSPTPSGPITPLNLTAAKVNGITNNSFTYYNVSKIPTIQLFFSSAIDKGTISNNISFKDNSGAPKTFSANTSNGDSVLVLQPQSPFQSISKYIITISIGIRSTQNAGLQSPINLNIITAIDSSDKFPQITDSALLTLVQQQTFKYFWDFGHPISGLARERNSSADVVTTGGSGFGVMAILVGIQRNFISRQQGLDQIAKIVAFLKTNVSRYHGAFPHWINGASGATVPFSTQDDGADLVETSYMMQGLLCARQFFNSGVDSEEINLRNDINALWNAVEWNWFRQNGQNVLYWHWSPDYNWAINAQISGWNEALIVYVLAASSNIDSIPKIVYDNGWAENGAMINGNSFYNIQLPLGPDLGGPLFFAHYSFLGINPRNLSDVYANYWMQNTAHSKINYNYCIANPHNFFGYSNLCWGLTASDDDINGYDAHAPNNDDGVISPTAAISSLPYTPTESMNALRFFYYKLGDKLWGQYGFVDAFNLNDAWFADSYLAIDQAPEIIMIENYRTSLLWNLFMSCPEIQNGLKRLGFQSPYIH